MIKFTHAKQIIKLSYNNLVNTTPAFRIFIGVKLYTSLIFWTAGNTSVMTVPARTSLPIHITTTLRAGKSA